MVLCASVLERNLLADTAKVVEKNKICRRKDEFCRKVVTDGLLALGYDASICKSRWEKSPSYPAGIYFLSLSLSHSLELSVSVLRSCLSLCGEGCLSSLFGWWGTCRNFRAKKNKK